jgi:hypothetical protein
MPDGTVRLDRPSPLPPGPVEVVLRGLPETTVPADDWWRCLQRLRAEREAAGRTFRTAEEIDSEIRELRQDRGFAR